jgi:hypothetical protein
MKFNVGDVVIVWNSDIPGDSASNKIFTIGDISYISNIIRPKDSMYSPGSHPPFKAHELKLVDDLTKLERIIYGVII